MAKRYVRVTTVEEAIEACRHGLLYWKEPESNDHTTWRRYDLWCATRLTTLDWQRQLGAEAWWSPSILVDDGE